MKTSQPQLIPTSGFSFEPNTHAYFYDSKRLTGVTTVLGTVLAKQGLIQWSANEAVKYLKTNGKPQEGGFWAVTDALLEEARFAHTKIRDNAADFGKKTHTDIENYVKNCIVKNAGNPIVESILDNPHLTAFIEWSFENEVTFLASEAIFYSPELFLAGTADLVFLDKEGKRCIGDAKIKNRIYGKDAFLQMAAYHMLSEGMGNPKGEKSLVLRIDPKTAEVEELWSFNVEADRTHFLEVLSLYRYITQ